MNTVDVWYLHYYNKHTSYDGKNKAIGVVLFYSEQEANKYKELLGNMTRMEFLVIPV